MLVLFLAPLLLAYTWWLGWRLLTPGRFSVWEKRWLAPLTGFGALTLCGAALCFLGLLYPVYIYGTFALLGVLVFAYSRRAKGDRSEPSTAESENESRDVPHLLKVITLSICAAVGVHTLLCALAPEVRSDPIRYHISMANQYAVRGGIEPLRETVWWSVPQYAECLYALGISLCNDTLSRLFHWWAGVIATLGVFAIANRWFGKSAAYWAVLLWVTTPMVSYEATTTYVELILTLWIQLALWSAGRSLEAPDTKRGMRWIAISGLALGMAFGTKYTAFGVQGLAWSLFPILYLFRFRGTPLAWVAVAISGLLVFAGYAPWFIRNWYYTGNPIYPLYNHIFGLVEGVDRGAELYFLSVWPGGELLKPGYYWEKFIRFFHSGYNFPGVALVVSIYWFAYRKRRKSLAGWGKLSRPELGYCALSLVAYVFLTKNNDGRFWVPTLALFLPFLGEGLARVFTGVSENRRSSSSLANILSLALIGVCLYNYVGQRMVFFRNFEESPWPILSEEARWDYYLAHERGDPNGRIYEKLIPEGARVFGLRFPERVRSVSSDRETLFDREGTPHRSNYVPLIDPFMESGRTPGEFLQAARAAGVEYLVLPDKEHPRPTDFWETAAQVGVGVEAGDGRLLRIPSLEPGAD